MSAEEAAERGGKLLPAPPLVARGDKMLSFLIEKWGFKEPVSCNARARLMQYSLSCACWLFSDSAMWHNSIIFSCFHDA